MTDRFVDRPAFIDLDPDTAEDAVGEARPPLWFRVVALVLLGIAGYVAVTLRDGPPLSWRHDYVSGRDAQPIGEGTDDADH